jgi:hypothetical protein
MGGSRIRKRRRRDREKRRKNEEEEEEDEAEEEDEDDGFSYVCAVCKDFGQLLCCERCREGFHLSCIGLSEFPEVDPWLCSTCSVDKVRCFECKAFGVLQDEMMQCTFEGCSKFYHVKCIKRLAQAITTTPITTAAVAAMTKTTTVAAVASSSLVCPHHHCHACVDSEDVKQEKLLRCLKCPISYHKPCAPDGTHLLEDMPGYLICRKHVDNWKHDSVEAEPSHNLQVIFKRLPLPIVVHDFDLPRYIFEAVRRLQKRPPSYCHIRRNVYMVKKMKRRQEDESLECMCKSTTGSTQQQTCAKDCLCGMLFTSCSASCGCGGLCTNLPFHKRPVCKLKVVKTEKCGWGLTADEDIKAGAFLVEYVGEVIDDKTCEERLWVMKEQGEINFYMCEISREMVIDATFKGNLSRYINHSCHPNSELQKWEIDGEIRIGIFAVTDIKHGEFITYDYQFIQFGTNQQCHCGSSDCRGLLGKPIKQPKRCTDAKALTSNALPQSLKKSQLRGDLSLQHSITIDHLIRQRKSSTFEARDDGVVPALHCEPTTGTSFVGLRIRVWWPLDQKFYHGKIVAYDVLTGKHQILYDDGEAEALCMSKERWEVEKAMSCSQVKLLSLLRQNYHSYF